MLAMVTVILPDSFCDVMPSDTPFWEDGLGLLNTGGQEIALGGEEEKQYEVAWKESSVSEWWWIAGPIRLTPLEWINIEKISERVGRS